MRLFIAINFDKETREKIIAVQQRLRVLGAGNFSQSENLHLTLAFLGEVAPTHVDAVQHAMNQTVVGPISLTFDHVGRFKRDGGDIWWIGLTKNGTLLSLQKELSGHLTDAGFHLEDRLFSPHITLARGVRLDTQPEYSTLLGSPFSTRASTISLMRSERISGRLVYIEQYCRG